MSVKIRLQRHGKKGKPLYHIVVADSRVKRDGKFIEKLGIYNPITNPAIVQLDIDAAVSWLEKGAEPTDTARSILSHKGVMMKKHLLGGVKKGAFSQEEAENRFNTWLESKDKQVQGKKDSLVKSKVDAKSAAFDAEKKVNEARIASAAAALVVEEPAVEVVEEAKEAEPTETKEEATPES